MQCALLATTTEAAISALFMTMRPKDLKGLSKHRVARRIAGTAVTMIEECAKASNDPSCPPEKVEVLLKARGVFVNLLQDVGALSSTIPFPLFLQLAVTIALSSRITPGAPRLTRHNSHDLSRALLYLFQSALGTQCKIAQAFS